MSYSLISFESPHYTIKADKLLEQNDIYGMIYPIPEEISPDCGMGIRVDTKEVPKVLAIFTQNEILHKAVYKIEQEKGTSLIERLQKEEKSQ